MPKPKSKRPVGRPPLVPNTELEARWYWMHKTQGLSYRRIAAIELAYGRPASHTTIMNGCRAVEDRLASRLDAV